MELEYLNYCQPRNPFYDIASGDADDFASAARSLPAGWDLRQDTDWTYCTPPELDLPPQGWKIHVSATPDNAADVLDLAARYCTSRGFMFKFIRARSVLLRRNSKYGDRGASGKFVTIYPPTEQHLERILTELGDELRGQQGPYILSDLRWGEGPLYVRYGGFVARYGPSESGRPVPCIVDDTGHLVPDVRGPSFRPPSWVTLPACLADSFAARNAGVLGDFPFRATRALHFSNGGGVYLATDLGTGSQVLLKEARPLAGLDEDGRDAVARLRQERWALERLAGLDCIPRLLDYRVGHEHHFLAREFVEGEPLTALVRRDNPLLDPGNRMDEAGRADACARYLRFATAVLSRVEDGVRRMHDRGVVFGDLHPNNILVHAEGSVSFIDLETSSAVGDRAAQAIGAPGFRAPAGFRGVEVDRYALGCIRLAMFLPLTVLLAWGRDKVDQLLDEIGRQFPIGSDFAAQVRADLAGGRQPLPLPADAPSDGTRWVVDVQGWPARRQQLVDSLLALAGPHRRDRLFPGDVQQFLAPGGGVNLASGAAGVLWTLAELDAPVPETLIDWLDDATAADDHLPAGGYDGLAGIALTLGRLGRPERAEQILAGVLDAPLDRLDIDMYSGTAGIGLTLLELDRLLPRPRLLDHARRIADDIDSRSQATGPGVGLLRGRSGVALFLLRLFERTGDEELLDRAVDHLRGDLARVGWSADRAPDVDSPWHSPVLAAGGAGIAVVADEILRHRADPMVEQAVRDARQACRSAFFQHAGLFRGRAGAMLVLRRIDRDRIPQRALDQHVRRLGWHAATVGDNVAFCGDHSLRLSTDLGSGTAGVLLALESVLTERQVTVPLLGTSS